MTLRLNKGLGERGGLQREPKPADPGPKTPGLKPQDRGQTLTPVPKAVPKAGGGPLDHFIADKKFNNKNPNETP